MQDIKKSILKTIAYFELFNYPLTVDEIFLFLERKYDYTQYKFSLNELVLERDVFLIDQFYCLQNERNNVTRRIRGNLKAISELALAKKIANFLILFPYVKGIAISGSLSKNYADENSDIDFFIIISKNRVWIARTFMHLFKQMFCWIKQERLLCMNYFLDEQNLEIQEKNLFIATEIHTLIPLFGELEFRNFFQVNSWSNQYLPNNLVNLFTNERPRNTILKNILEALFNNSFGDKLDDKLLSYFQKRWKRKTEIGRMKRVDFNKHYSKPHPEIFLNALLKRYDEKVFNTINKYEGKQTI